MCVSMHGVVRSRAQCHRAQMEPSTHCSSSTLARLIEHPVTQEEHGVCAQNSALSAQGVPSRSLSSHFEHSGAPSRLEQPLQAP